MESLVIINNGKIIVSSRQVAENFGKEHRHALDSIRDIIRSAGNSATPMFCESNYIHQLNKER